MIFCHTKIKKGATDICNAFFCGERGIKTIIKIES